MIRRTSCRTTCFLALMMAAVTALVPTRVTAQPAVVPSPEDFLGYPLGADFSTHAGVRDYARMLGAEAAHAQYRPYGRSVGGRDLVQLVIGRPDHIDRLDEILALNAELTQPGTSEARARQIAATNPAVLYFSYGIHGNESSSSEAAMWTAYDLVSGAPEIAGVLDSLILVIDPVANPDGRDRYVHWYRSVVGAIPNADPQTLEHREPWPGGRFNHYLFDLNRDWAWMTQPETRARIATWWRWNPQVHVDFHEMSPNSTYFFFPAAAPINPIYSEHILAWGERFGRANAQAFDARGWRYFTAESFDMLYPGYGDSWPSLHGAIGMTYEQAGGPSAGLVYERTDGDTLTLARRASQHRTAATATLRTAANEKTRLLLDFAEAHRTAGQGGRDYLLVPGSDPARLDALVDHLLAQGIEVERAQSSMPIGALAYPGFATRRQFPAGTALVRARQPRGRLAITLLQPETELRGDFSYDLSAWSLPYAYGVEAHQTTAAPASGWARAIPSTRPMEGLSLSGFGYLVAPSDPAGAGIVRYLADGESIRVLTRPANFAGREWPAGSWFISARPDGAEREAIEEAGLAPYAHPIAGGLAQGGIDLGSERARTIRLPRVALVGGAGTSPTSYGAHWFHLEQQLGFPFDALLLPELQRLDLTRYEVIVLPETTGSFPEEAREALDEWVSAGGHLVAVGRGAEAAGRIAEIELREANDEPDDIVALDRLLATREERERQEWEEAVPGAILPIRLDRGHPLAWGATFDGSPDRLFVLNTAGRSFEPRVGAETVGSFGPQLTATSGVISPENLRRLERSAWLITRSVGRGQVTLFADDPLFRLFWHATKPLYLNALLYGGF